MNKIRSEVMAQLVQTCRDASAAGKDGIAEIERCFPGTPIEVATDAWCRASEESVEAWWQSVEKTIEIAAIRQALLTAPAVDPGAGSDSSDFFETSIIWAIRHLQEALVCFHSNERARFRSSMQKFGGCANAMLDTYSEVKL